MTRFVVPLVSIALFACTVEGLAPSTDTDFGSDAEIEAAEELLTTARTAGYATPDGDGWSFFPTGSTHAEDIVPSASPHGEFAQIFVNKTFRESVGLQEPAQAAEGSLIIKHNLTGESTDEIDSITLMLKREAGYSPDAADWFWAKLGPRGEILSNPEDVALAGRIGSVEGGGCIGCHSSQEGDFVVSPVVQAFGAESHVELAATTMGVAMGESYAEPDEDRWFFFPSEGDDDDDPIVPSSSPHGEFAQIFVNKIFRDSVQSDSDEPAQGSIIIKHNLTARDRNAIDSITMMIKLPDTFDPATKNWFWTKMDAQGAVAANPEGVKMAGKIGKIGGGGCIGCHSAKPESYILSNMNFED